MLKTFIFLITLLFSFSLADYDYALEDINSSSEFYGEVVGTSYFSNQVTLHYFGHFS